LGALSGEKAMLRKLSTLCRATAAGLSLLLVLGGGAAQAKKVTNEFEDLKLTFPAGAAGMPDNIDLVVKGATKFQVRLSIDGFNPPLAASGGHFVFSAKDGTTVAAGSMVTVRVRGIGGFNKAFQIESVVFKQGDTVLAQGTATGGGLKGDPIFTLFNDLVPSFDLGIDNLRFCENHTPLDFDTLDPGATVSGSCVPQLPAVLDGPGSTADYTVSPILDGLEFIAQGDIVPVGETVPTGKVIYGFMTTDIPEPASLALLLPGVIAALGLGAAGARRA
jgi:hypothetical protein